VDGRAREKDYWQRVFLVGIRDDFIYYVNNKLED
jgi:hypothetical protein